MISREFAHLHPTPDERAHAMLPPDVAVQAVEAGWAEPQPMAQLGFLAANAVMIYAPRDRSEVEVVYRRTVRQVWKGKRQGRLRGDPECNRIDVVDHLLRQAEAHPLVTSFGLAGRVPEGTALEEVAAELDAVLAGVGLKLRLLARLEARSSLSRRDN